VFSRFHGGGPDGVGLSQLIARLLFPVLLGIVGLYLAEVIKTGDRDP
jgi:hypothetical protein